MIRFVENKKAALKAIKESKRRRGLRKDDWCYSYADIKLNGMSYLGFFLYFVFFAAVWTHVTPYVVFVVVFMT